LAGSFFLLATGSFGEFILDWVFILAGFGLLLGGGDMLVGGAVSVARRMGLSPMMIGVTLVGFGTSTPELMTSLQAAFENAPGIAVGNVVGSNIANILLIIGVAALIRPIAVQKHGFRRDGTALALGTLLGAGALATGLLSFWVGVGLVVGLIAYLAATLLLPMPGETGPDLGDCPVHPPLRALLTFALGLAGVLLGARLLVDGAVGVARDLGVSETLIGLTIVAVGTSLPELVTSVVAARKGESDVALGNILGSNVFNLLGILGITAMVTPLAVPAEILSSDLWIMLAVTLALLAVAITGWKISRREGAVFLLGYIAYLGWLMA
jgi:cation:H+ antiporter